MMSDPARHDHTFMFDPGDDVLILDDIHGVVIGQQHVCGDEDRFLIEYVTGAGEPLEKWWRETALDHAPTDPGDADAVPGSASDETDNVIPLRRAS